MLDAHFYLGNFVAAALSLFSINPGSASEIVKVFVSNFSDNKSASVISVTIHGKIYLSADISSTTAPVLRIRAIADLSDLQNKLSAIIPKIKLPSANCTTKGIDNLVASLSNVSLIFANDETLFHADSSAVIWVYAPSPALNSRVNWEIRNIGSDVETSVPVPYAWTGNPIKTTLGMQPFSLGAPFSLEALSASAIQVVNLYRTLEYGTVAKDWCATSRS